MCAWPAHGWYSTEAHRRRERILDGLRRLNSEERAWLHRFYRTPHSSHQYLPAMLACMTDMSSRKWGASVVAKVAVASAKSEVVVEPRFAKRGKTNVVRISRAGEALYEIRNKSAKSAYLAECGTPLIVKCDCKAYARRVWQCLVSMKLSVDQV